MTDENRILIAGAGPVGMSSGYYLARHGVPVTVFDTLAETPRDHRASTVHPSTLDMIAPLDMPDRLIAMGLISPIFQFRDRVSGRIVADFDYGLIGDETGYPFALQVEQHKVINVAHALADPLPDFDLRRGHTVTGVEQDADGVTVTVRNPAGEDERHRGRFLMACDGGRSEIRKGLGIDFPGFTWPERFIISTTEFDFGAQENGGYSYRSYVAHPDQWCALIKVAGDDMRGLWRILLPAGGDEPDEVVQSEAWVQALMAECLPQGAPYAIVHRNLYHVHQRVAESFRAGRVILAGDSAHVNNPLGGMGMNGGIHDGLNAAEKLVRIWRGEAKDWDAELARYDRQRRPMATKFVQAQSIRNKEILQEKDPATRQARLDDLTATAEDPARCRPYLLNASLINMVREANAAA
jgi:3-(3-hydroxy-phenyl)propionate hydroxylase